MLTLDCLVRENVQRSWLCMAAESYQILHFLLSFYKVVSIFLSLLTLINDCLIIITVIQCKVLLKEITLGNIPNKDKLSHKRTHC